MFVLLPKREFEWRTSNTILLLFAFSTFAYRI